MANYYHEARAHVRRLKEFSDDSKRRAERRAEFIGAQAEYPINFLTVEGHGVKMYQDTELYNQMENGMGVMIECNGQPGVLIDRYDGRALLDMLTDFKRQEFENQEVDDLISFEAYRDLIRIKSLGLTEQEALHMAEIDNVSIRASAKANAAQASRMPFEAKHATSLDLPASIHPNVVAKYGSTAVILENDLSSEISSEDEPHRKKHCSHDTSRNAETRQKETIDREVLDTIGYKDFAIDDFSHKLKKVLKAEGNKEGLKEIRSNKPRKRHGSTIERRRAHSESFPEIPSTTRRLSNSTYLRNKAKHKRNFTLNGEKLGKVEFIRSFSNEQELPDHIDETYQSSWDMINVSERSNSQITSLKMHGSSADIRQNETKNKMLTSSSLHQQSPSKIEEAISRRQQQSTERKETPQEKLRRLTAAQLNKQAHKDAIQMTQKRLQADKEQQARAQIERAGLNLSSMNMQRKDSSLS